MGKLQAKGKSGSAVNYITRTKAVRKLQITLSDFRRLCILKGIFPRDPKNKKKILKGSSAPTTFYFTKDIQYLMHDPLIFKLREHKIFIRKLNKAMGKGQKDTVKRLKENEPEFKLDHVIKERYPTFIDALRDLDDALCMIFLFANLPQTEKIKNEVVAKCQRLAIEFQHYVMKTNALQKVFVSIKGIYYQACIMGQTVTWLVPYDFSMDIPYDVDIRVMLTFLEFYSTLIEFVNFKLFNDINLVYPPEWNEEILNEGGIFNAMTLKEKNKPLSLTVSSTELNESVDQNEIDSIVQNEILKKSETKAATESTKTEEVKFQVGNNAVQTIEEIEQSFKDLELSRKLFQNKVFYISRECPKNSLEFVIKSFSGSIASESTNERIDYYILDRPSNPETVNYLNRYYIQPQWVYDCINAKAILDCSPYEIGKNLPPHLSPFVEYKEGDYIPDDDKEIVTTTEDSEKKMAIGLMSKKDKKLYDQIMYGKKKRENEASKIRQRKKVKQEQ